ncbi:ATP-binding protein [Aidingimonas halophila]|uniref:histidine kinase n=1 Tax=Aidingimonas halophila TaxID=574349 RepID=A0A1H2QH71_9GAMM|nr:ATP-binding protein [Aidingimonas halophila]GHC20789.1 histidine kinase [Aidingimonas halophila]SDW06270.1 two-component system, NarL family, sensor histidine kinase BarA [Aidingimonas halophila]
MSLKTRLIALLLGIPLCSAILVATLAVFNDIQQRRTTLGESLTTHAEMLVPLLTDTLKRHEAASANDESLQRDLRAQLQPLLNIDDVRSVTLRLGDETLLAELGQQPTRHAPSSPEETRLITDGPQWYLDMPLPTRIDDRTVWLELEADTTSLALGTYRFLSLIGLALLAIGIPVILFAYLFSQRTARLVDSFRQALSRLYTDDEFTPLKPTGPSELAGLSEDINALARRQEEAKEETQRHIEQTTQELQESMETIEIQNIELDMAHRRALDANQIKSEFLANISHEIRTPLNGIIGFCQLLERSQLEARQRDWLGHVQNASDSLLSLINDILDFSKLEAGKLELETVALDMVELVDDVLGLQAPQAHEKGLHLLGLVYDDVPAQLQGDPLRIKQVLTNLVHNAIKFTQEGDITVRVMLDDIQQCQASSEATAKDHTADTSQWQVKLRVTVTDTGIGLSSDYHQRLFKAFSQASISDTRQYGGTGLGLKICKQLLEQMGGNIDVDSKPGEGSTFSFTLPLLAQTLEEREPELTLNGELIVLQEPHIATQRAFSHLLQSWGARVASLETLAPDANPALCIISLDNGTLDESVQSRGWLDSLQTLTCPSLVLLNASPVDTHEYHLPTEGDLLTKPVSRRALADSIKRLLTHGGSQPQQHDERRHFHDLHQARVMVVDDSASNRLLIHETLKGMGVETCLASSGEEALELARQQEADLVLMDIRMEGMDGVETMRGLRHLPGRWRHCPFIAVTAHALEDERRRLLNAGMHDVLIKPVQINDLVQMVNAHLGLESPERDLPLPAPDSTVTATRNDLAIVDHELGMRLAGGDKRLADRLFEQLIEEIDDSEPALENAWQADDKERLLDIIHRLNGACRYCGVPRLALLAETLETRLRVNSATDIDDLLAALRQAMDELRCWEVDSRHAQSAPPSQDSSTTTAEARSFSSDNDR